MSDLTELFTWTCERCNGLTKVVHVLFEGTVCIDLVALKIGYSNVLWDGAGFPSDRDNS